MYHRKLPFGPPRWLRLLDVLLAVAALALFWAISSGRLPERPWDVLAAGLALAWLIVTEAGLTWDE